MAEHHGIGEPVADVGDKRWEDPVATKADLPTENNLPNDRRTVRDNGEGLPAEYVWFDNPSYPPARWVEASFEKMGWVSGGVVTRGAGLVLNVTAGVGYLVTNGTRTRVEWDADSITLTASSAEHVYVTAAGVLAKSESPPALDEIILLASAAANGSTSVFLASRTVIRDHRPAAEHEYHREVIGPIAVSGLQGTENSGTPLHVDVASGVFYISDNRKVVSATADITFTYWYRDGSGGYISVPGTTALDDGFWDNDSGTLAALTAGKLKKDVLYVALSADGVEYHVVYGTEQFDDSVSGVASTLQVAPPPFLRDFAIRSSGFLLEDGAGAVSRTSDERPFLGQLTASADEGAGGGAALLGRSLFFEGDSSNPAESTANDIRTLTLVENTPKGGLSAFVLPPEMNRTVNPTLSFTTLTSGAGTGDIVWRLTAKYMAVGEDITAPVNSETIGLIKAPNTAEDVFDVQVLELDVSLMDAGDMLVLHLERVAGDDLDDYDQPISLVKQAQFRFVGS